jgi:membrane protein
LAGSDTAFSITLRRINFRLRRLKYDLLELTAVKFLLVLGKKSGHDNISNTAASIAYYAVLSLFPMMLALLAIFGLFLPSESVQQQLIRFFAQYLPGSVSFLQNNISDIINLRGAFGIVGILGLVWSGSGVFSAVTHAINRAWNIQYQHPFYLKKPREIGMVLGTGVLFLLSLGASAFLSFLLSFLGSLSFPISGALINIGTAIMALIFSLTIFLLIHKLSPAVGISWRYIWPGAVLSTFLFEVAKTVFVLYLNNFNHYDKIYGSIASVIALLVWIYYSAFILLLGAEFSSLLAHYRREGAFKARENTDLVKDLQE